MEASRGGLPFAIFEHGAILQQFSGAAEAIDAWHRTGFDARRGHVQEVAMKRPLRGSCSMRLRSITVLSMALVVVSSGVTSPPTVTERLQWSRA